MKKKLSILAASLMVIAVAASLSACGEKKESAPATTAAETVAETTVAETTVVETTVAETTAAETTAAEETVAETQPEYMGYQYSAKDPWGGEVSITLRQEKDGKLEWTYTDVLPEDMMVYTEVTSDYANGYTEWTIEGDVSDKEHYTYKYSGNLKLQGGGIELTYTDGSITCHSENGDSDSYNVGPVKDSGKNTVFLEKVVDNN